MKWIRRNTINNHHLTHAQWTFNMYDLNTVRNSNNDLVYNYPCVMGYGLWVQGIPLGVLRAEHIDKIKVEKKNKKRKKKRVVICNWFQLLFTIPFWRIGKKININNDNTTNHTTWNVLFLYRRRCNNTNVNKLIE